MHMRKDLATAHQLGRHCAADAEDLIEMLADQDHEVL